MQTREAYLAALRSLCDELADGRRLSTKVLPLVEDSAALSEALARACQDPTHPLREATAAHGGDTLADAVANARPAETMAGQLDGRAAACAVAAMLLLEYDAEAPKLAQLAKATPIDELTVVTQNTDTYPMSADATANDPVQSALLAHLCDEADSTTKLASALYRCTASADATPLHELAKSCASFLHECRALLEEPATAAAAMANPVRAERPLMVDRSTSPELFYELADNPFKSRATTVISSPQSAEAPPTPRASAFSEFSFSVPSGGGGGGGGFSFNVAPVSYEGALDEDTRLMRALELSFSS